jgi:hypothetical protein
MSLFELDDVFTYQDANDIKRLWASETAPADPGDGEVWLDTSFTPNRLKRYNITSGWEIIGDMTAGELLTLLKTVDGTSSGLDSDKLDGQEGSFYQNAGNLNAGTIPSGRLSAGDLLAKIVTVDGSGSGLDADTLDGQEAASFVRTNAGTDVNANTEWQDSCQARFGNDADLKIWHNNGESWIQNYTGRIIINNISNGSNIDVTARNNSGEDILLLSLDPDTERVTTKLDRASLPDLWYDGETGDHESPFIQTSQENIVQINTNVIRNFAYAFTSTPRVVLTQHIQANIYLKTVSTTSITFRTDTANTPITYFALGTLS